MDSIFSWHHTQKKLTIFVCVKVLFRVPGAPQADWVDIYNRLYRERIIFLGQEIDDEIANQIIAVMLYLESEDNGKPIYLYINSPGGSVIAGMAIYDTIKHIKSEVVTINVGLAASMASFLLGGGEKGKRLALPHSRIMIHQPMVCIYTPRHIYFYLFLLTRVYGYLLFCYRFC